MEKFLVKEYNVYFDGKVEEFNKNHIIKTETEKKELDKYLKEIHSKYCLNIDIENIYKEFKKHGYISFTTNENYENYVDSYISKRFEFFNNETAINKFMESFNKEVKLINDTFSS